jgi:hypothetical protein
MLKCLKFWIYDLDIITCFFVKVTKWRLNFGALTKMGRTICINESLYLLGWRKHLQSSKRWWIDFLYAWILLSVKLMTSLCLVPSWRNMVIACNVFKHLRTHGWKYTYKSVGCKNPMWNIWEPKRLRWMQFLRF